MFAGSLRAGQRAAAVMSLIQSAKLNGHDPYAYLKDVLARLPTHKNNQIGEYKTLTATSCHQGTRPVNLCLPPAYGRYTRDLCQSPSKIHLQHARVLKADIPK